MTNGWTSDELQQIGTTRELHVASRRTDGTLRAWVPIWVVCVGPHVFVRTWYRRKTGWFGQIIDSHRAHPRAWLGSRRHNRRRRRRDRRDASTYRP